ncbi:MAG: FlgD immunoglobulin-like domain containing protein [Armatimonadota bacterium]
MLRTAKIFAIVLSAVALIVLSAPVFAQDYTAGTSNEYLLVMMGQQEDVYVYEPEEKPVEKPRSGRWVIYTVKGDPEISDDDNIPLVRTAADGGPGWRHGFTTIRVDNTSEIFGDTSRGAWVLYPYISDKETGNYVGLTGQYVCGLWYVNASAITARFRMALVRDQVRLEVVLTNYDTKSHYVGLRHCCDVTTDGNIDSITHPYVPGSGVVMAETDYLGSAIPDYFEMYDSISSPKVAVRNTLNEQDATAPDRAAFGSWQNMQGSDWDFTAIPDRAVGDYGWALWWAPALLNPRESRTIITYFGMAAATSSWTSDSGSIGSVPKQDPFCVAVQGPKSLSIDYDSSQSSDTMLQTNPFKIKAYIYNLYTGDTTLKDVQVHLTLPDGLELVDGTATQEITSIPPESEGLPVSWNVKATGKVTGTLDYIVTVSGSPGLQKQLTRSIVVPSTGTTQIQTGWQMISTPFKFEDSRIEEALNLADDTYSASSWNPQTQSYDTVTNIAPGKGYWLKSTIDRPTTRVSTSAKPLSGAESYSIDLYTGWNQFGNPYIYPIPWGRVRVLGTAQDGLLTIDEAVSKNLIRKTIYWWDTAAGEYSMSSDEMENLVPWQGYWIKAKQPCQLIIPAVSEIGATLSGDTTRSRGKASSASSTTKCDGWNLKLVARAGEVEDSTNYIGIDSRASDTYDSADIEEPPSPGDYVSISFPHTDWGANSGNYLSDIRRSTGGTQTWEFNVTCDKKNTDVVLTWPALSGVSKDYTLKMTDVDGSLTRYMRTTSSYKYNSGEGGVRRFKLVAEPRGNNSLIISGLGINTSRANGSATISYNLSADASTDVRIKSTSGRMVRSLAKGRGVTRGINNLTWNYRDETGEAVPAGSYMLEVVATTQEGEVVKTIRPFLVAR